jgi:hypothetical protein
MRSVARVAFAATLISIGCGTSATPPVKLDAGDAADQSTALDATVAPDGTGEETATGEDAAGEDVAQAADAGMSADVEEPSDASEDRNESTAPPQSDAGWLGWSALRNPILQVAGWATKDVAVVYEGGVYYFYYSAFFPDTGMERCHIAMSTSLDLKTFTPARVLFDAVSEGYGALCSPDVSLIGGQYVMRFDSWAGTSKPQGLYYSTSNDLVNWSAVQPLAQSLWAGVGGYDPTLAEANGQIYLLYQSNSRPRVAVAPAVGGPWSLVGKGTPALLMQSGRDNGLTHENFQLIAIDGKWYSMETDYPPIEPYLYTMVGTGTVDTDWLNWNNGYMLTVAKEAFNTHLVGSAAYLNDWRSHDGFFYLFYAGATEGTSHAGRGNCTIAVSRSTDLKTWIPAGQ